MAGFGCSACLTGRAQRTPLGGIVTLDTPDIKCAGACAEGCNATFVGDCNAITGACYKCFADHWLDTTRGACHMCPNGSHSAGGGEAKCACAPGEQWISGSGCAPCNAGTWQRVGISGIRWLTDPNKPCTLRCAAGCTECAPATSACLSCLPNFRLSLAGTCVPCAGQSKSDGGTAEACHCEPGHAWIAGVGCQPCPPGTARESPRRLPG